MAKTASWGTRKAKPDGCICMARGTALPHHQDCPEVREEGRAEFERMYERCKRCGVSEMWSGRCAGCGDKRTKRQGRAEAKPEPVAEKREALPGVDWHQVKDLARALVSLAKDASEFGSGGLGGADLEEAHSLAGGILDALGTGPGSGSCSRHGRIDGPTVRCCAACVVEMGASLERERTAHARAVAALALTGLYDELLEKCRRMVAP